MELGNKAGTFHGEELSEEAYLLPSQASSRRPSAVRKARSPSFPLKQPPANPVTTLPQPHSLPPLSPYTNNGGFASCDFCVIYYFVTTNQDGKLLNHSC